MSSHAQVHQDVPSRREKSNKSLTVQRDVEGQTAGVSDRPRKVIVRARGRLGTAQLFNSPERCGRPDSWSFGQTQKGNSESSRAARDSSASDGKLFTEWLGVLLLLFETRERFNDGC